MAVKAPFVLFLLAILSFLPGFTRADSCNADNCLRALRATSRSSDSNSFCSAYIHQTTPTVYVTHTSSITTSKTNTALSTKIITSTKVASTATALSTSIVDETLTVTITPETIDVLREKRNPPAVLVPTYLSACSSSSSRLSSACSCYIGATASLVTVTLTDTTVISTTNTATHTTSTTTTLPVTSTASTTTTETVTTYLTSTVKPPPAFTPCNKTPGGAQPFFYIQASSNDLGNPQSVNGNYALEVPLGAEEGYLDLAGNSAASSTLFTYSGPDCLLIQAGGTSGGLVSAILYGSEDGQDDNGVYAQILFVEEEEFADGSAAPVPCDTDEDTGEITCEVTDVNGVVFEVLFVAGSGSLMIGTVGGPGYRVVVTLHAVVPLSL